MIEDIWLRATGIRARDVFHKFLENVIRDQKSQRLVSISKKRIPVIGPSDPVAAKVCRQEPSNDACLKSFREQEIGPQRRGTGCTGRMQCRSSCATHTQTSN